MQLHCSPKEQILFDQLKLIERRRFRMLESVANHFSNFDFSKYLGESAPELQNLIFKDRLDDQMDDSGPKTYLRRLTLLVNKNEALQVKALMSCPAIPQNNIRKLLLQGARIAGQDAARELSGFSARRSKGLPLSLSELFSILNRLVFFEFPDQRNVFASIRPLSDISVHFKTCLQAEAWETAAIDPKIMVEIESKWIKGILDIIRPDIQHERLKSIAYGDEYGRDKYYPLEKNVTI